MITNLKQFNDTVEKSFKRLTEEQVVLAQKKIVLDLLRKVIRRTPVDTGRARGNWQVSIDFPATGELEVLHENAHTIFARGNAAIKKLPPYKIVWLTNNVSYIVALENGHSKRSPEGMLRVSLAEITEELS
jgi:hypothetical protein